MADLIGIFGNRNHIIAVNTAERGPLPAYHISKIHLQGGGVSVDIVSHSQLKKYLNAGHYRKIIRRHT